MFGASRALRSQRSRLCISDKPRFAIASGAAITTTLRARSEWKDVGSDGQANGEKQERGDRSGDIGDQGAGNGVACQENPGERRVAWQTQGSVLTKKQR